MKKRTTILMIAFLPLILMSVKTFAGNDIKGFVRYHQDPTKPLAGVEVGLFMDGTLIKQTVTAHNGKYTFKDVEPGIYTIKNINSNLKAGGLELSDYELIMAIIHNEYQPTEIEKLAADLDQNNVIDQNDADMWIANWDSGFEPKWVFEEITILHNTTKKNVPEMGGSSSGDVNGTFVPTGRSNPLIETEYFAKKFSREFSIEINAQSLTEITGMGLIIGYPEEITINEVNSQLGDLTNIKVLDNTIVITWVGEFSLNPKNPVIVINGSANEKYNGGDVKLTINEKSHFVSNGKVVTPRFSVPFLTTIGEEYLQKSYPNPADNYTRVSFTLPCNSHTQLNIYNLTGQLVKTVINEEMISGHHTIEIPVSDLKEGVYFYNLTTSGDIKINQSKRLVVVH